MYRLFAINKGQRGAHETSSDWNSSLVNACCLLNIVLELNEEEVEYYWFHTDLIIPSPFVTNLWILWTAMFCPWCLFISKERILGMFNTTADDGEVMPSSSSLLSFQNNMHFYKCVAYFLRVFLHIDLVQNHFLSSAPTVTTHHTPHFVFRPTSGSHVMKILRLSPK